MLDPRAIRANPERLKQIVRLRKVDPAKADVDRWLELDEQPPALQTEIDALNAEKKQIAGLGRTDPDAARSKGQELRERVAELRRRLSTASCRRAGPHHGVAAELDRRGDAGGPRRGRQRRGVRLGAGDGIPERREAGQGDGLGAAYAPGSGARGGRLRAAALHRARASASAASIRCRAAKSRAHASPTSSATSP